LRFFLEELDPSFRGEQVISIVDRLVTNPNFWDLADRTLAVAYQHVVSVHEIGIYVLDDDFVGFALDVRILEQPLLLGIVDSEADDYAMHGCFSRRFIHPLESPVREAALGAQKQLGFKRRRTLQQKAPPKRGR